MEKLIFSNSDEYLAQVGWLEARQALTELRDMIRRVAPDAEECVTYGMPGFKQGGYLAAFFAFKKHCSLFPGGLPDEFLPELAPWKVSRGTIQFTPDHPLPEDLVRRIVQFRLAANLAKKK